MLSLDAVLSVALKALPVTVSIFVAPFVAVLVILLLVLLLYIIFGIPIVICRGVQWCLKKVLEYIKKSLEYLQKKVSEWE